MHLMPLCGHSRLPTLFLIAIIITVFNVQSCYSDCAVNEFLCRNGDCILVEQKCNDHVDCADGSDEGDICNCIDTENTFKCASDSLCLFDIQRCDGYMDCPGGEDEMNCGGNFGESPLLILYLINFFLILARTSPVDDLHRQRILVRKRLLLHSY